VYFIAIALVGRHSIGDGRAAVGPELTQGIEGGTTVHDESSPLGQQLLELTTTDANGQLHLVAVVLSIEHLRALFEK